MAKRGGAEKKAIKKSKAGTGMDVDLIDIVCLLKQERGDEPQQGEVNEMTQEGARTDDAKPGWGVREDLPREGKRVEIETP